MVEENQDAGLTRDGTARRVNRYPDALTPDPSPSGRTASEGRFSTPPQSSDAVFLFSGPFRLLKKPLRCSERARQER
jgi:hypothetical protein